MVGNGLVDILAERPLVSLAEARAKMKDTLG